MGNVIEVKPLTRVEGHGAVRVFMDGKRVDRVELALVESPRLFEGLLLGKHYTEIPDIICRICSLCSTIHRVTALQAVEKAIAVQVSKETELYRRLIVLGGHIQSHALHLFCLALPDYFNSAGFADLARQAPDLLKVGLKIKAVGNDIQETVGGRLIHPVNVKIGGMGRKLGSKDMLRLRQGLESVLADTVRTAELFASFATPGPQLPTPIYLGIKGGTTEPLFGDKLVTSTGRSARDADYTNALKERISGHSHGKISTFGNEVVVVGALARLNLEMELAAEAQAALARLLGIRQGDMWYNNLAQAIELIHAAEAAMEIIEVLSYTTKRAEPPLINAPQHAARGTAVTEAPRGVLIHSYAFDNSGFCTAADIVTPTAINQLAMERDLLYLAKAMEGAEEEELKLRLERLVRTYDPCISCAVHVIRL
ncbi:Ni/Fe hydrogenase subunit alpha [Geotalea sp. SG265]|uniref:Ni/Fe hydrogenase subunit alpha n=1 Tax=Geotalea sp. SG265 TaxID=2922867 RepID=UPI001FAF16C9|nr:Ni/Fe hydrogenase subunit alpha [Geotalea sp. SG265]